jgi:hypothetical protein
MEPLTLATHEAHSEQRAEHLEATINRLKDISMHGVDDRVDVNNILGGGMGGGMGAVAGGLGGLLLGALLGNRRGLFGGDGVGETGTAVPEFFTLNKLGNIEAQINATAMATQNAVQNDGDKTRALITAQYEATLNRQLTEANAALIELRSDQRAAERARTIEINMTQNQAQAQTQNQIGSLVTALQTLMNEQQRQGQVIYNTGLMAASGTQAASTSQVRL